MEHGGKVVTFSVPDDCLDDVVEGESGLGLAVFLGEAPFDLELFLFGVFASCFFILCVLGFALLNQILSLLIRLLTI